jgi:ferric-dicitrate binding protein FerR (iron transport regulator)
MNRIEFQQLLRRYLDGICTPQEHQLINQLYDFIGEAHAPPELSAGEADELEEKLWKGIEAQTFAALETKIVPMESAKSPRKRWLQPSFRVAAAVALLGLVLGWFLSRLDTKVALEPTEMAFSNLKTKKNETNMPILMRLEDSSTVQLQPNSQIRYAEPFDKDNRRVYLEGNAFFNITHQRDKPFFVHAGAITTQVLGTSFWVTKSTDTKEISVEVKTGKVLVTGKKNKGNKEDGVVLKRNQKATYLIDNQLFVTGLVAQPALPEKSNELPNITIPEFTFKDAPLWKIVETLEKAYGIQIVLSNDALQRCNLTADLNKQSLYEKLDLICSAINAHYEIKSTTILISGRGCK